MVALYDIFQHIRQNSQQALLRTIFALKPSTCLKVVVSICCIIVVVWLAPLLLLALCATIGPIACIVSLVALWPCKTLGAPLRQPKQDWLP